MAYITTVLYCGFYTWYLVRKVVCILRYSNRNYQTSIISFSPSIFPSEIFEEMEDIDFDLFNKEEGSYQLIVPKLLHFVHRSLVCRGDILYLV